jgi:type III secretion protein T
MPDVANNIIGYLTLTAVCSVRLFMIMTIFPPTSDGVLQGMVRNAMVVLFSSYIAYGQPASFVAALHGITLVEVGLREALIGMALGYAASLVFWVAESAGVYIDDLTGYNAAQMSNPMNHEQSTPTAILLTQIATVAFWALGGMMFLLGTLYDSYRWWPIISSTPNMMNVLESFVITQSDTLMQTVAKMAAPMVFVLLLIDFGFGVASKSASKLDLMTLSQPVKGAVTVLMLALFVGVFVDQVREQVTLSGFSAEIHGLLVQPPAKSGNGH